MTLLAWGTSLADMPGDNGILSYTTASRLGPGVSEGIHCPDTSEFGHRQLNFTAASEIWLSFYYGETDTSSGAGRRYGVNFYSGTGLWFKWGGSGINNLNVNLQYWNGSAWTTVGSSIGLTGNTVNRILIHIKIHDTAGILEWYNNGVLIASSTGIDTNIGSSTLDNIRFSTVEAGRPSGCVYSAIMVADEDLTNWMYLQTAINGNGAETAWTGDYTNVDEPGRNDADIIHSNTNGAVETYTKAALPSIYNTFAVKGVGVMARAMRGTTGPQNLQLAARSGSTNGFSANKALTIKWDQYREFFSTNPDTAAAWTFAEADAAQVGVKAVT